MDDLKEYVVILNGSETTAMLTEADAKRFGGRLVTPDPAPETAPVAPSSKGRRARTARRVPDNKGR